MSGSVWRESRSLLRITLLFIVRTNPRYERNPSTTYEREGGREGEGGARGGGEEVRKKEVMKGG